MKKITIPTRWPPDRPGEEQEDALLEKILGQFQEIRPVRDADAEIAAALADLKAKRMSR